MKTASLQAWILAARPRTLPVSLPPIIVGNALASQKVEALNWVLIAFALFCSLGIQIGTNLVNDALDFKKGADGIGRLGPQRVTQAGIFTIHQVLKAAYLAFAFALISGLPLIHAGGWPVALILLVAIACGYFYTGGPFPLSYVGISDLFVLIFFGWAATCVMYYLQVGEVHFSCFLAATQIGFLAVVPHAINNLRDHLSDAQVKKQTVAVRFGQHFARREITFLSFAPFLLGLFWIYEGAFLMAFLPLLSYPFISRNVTAIWQTRPAPIYNEFLARSALCGLIFSCLLALGAVMQAI